jgi:putative two-component system response regulator
VPPRALVISLLALSVPVWAHLAFPGIATDELGLLVWLAALVPPFLLTYYRSWVGASAALAASMAALVVTQLGLLALGLEPPPVSVLLALTSVLIAVSLGAGWLSGRLHDARREAQSMALTDGLTGLANRRHLRVFLESAFGAAARGMPLSVVIFDLDRFKEVNDVQGHAQGDLVLRVFGDILRKRTREMNLVGRWGGEEFLAVLSAAPTSGARVFAEHVRKALEGTTFSWGAVTVSAGIAGYDPGMTTPDVLVAAADQALYRAKEDGGNTVVVAPRRTVVALEAPRSPRALRTTGTRAVSDEEPQEHPGDPARAAGTELPGGGGEVLLVVDDDRDARRSVGRALSKLGYHVLQASGPEEALEIARGREEPVDLLVTDVIMPTMSGFRLVEMLLEHLPDLRVVYMSGYRQDGIDWEGTPGRVSTFLSKPMSVEDLSGTVRRVLDERTRSRDAGDSGPPASHPAAFPEGGSAEVAAAVPTAPADLAGAHVLVVDDDQDVLRSLCLLLGRCGFANVRGTTDPADIPVHLAHFKPDLVLLDLMMPELDGLEVLSAFHDFGSQDFLPVVAITGSDDPDLRRRALMAGASDFVRKPVDVWEMEPRLRNLLRIRSMTRRLAAEAEALEARVAARTAELEEARTEILLRLARAAEYRDDVTGHHAERVGALVGLIAETMGMESSERDLLERAAPLHDLGKIGVSDRILRKNAPLDEQEMAEMRQHTHIGARILSKSRVPLLQLAREIALTHHERWDGSGYPRGLKGEEIPLAARIVAVADVFDSLAHDRPYRAALTEEQALDHLRASAGTLYDPEVVDVLLDLHRQGLVADAEAVRVVARRDSVTPPWAPGDPDPREKLP